MPSRKFALEKGGPQRVEISWRGMWKEINVKLDGYVLGTMANSKELKQGRQFMLPDNSVLTVQMVSRAMSPELQVLRNGQPLPGSDSDPSKRLSVAYAVIFFIAGLNIVLGLIAVLTESEFLTERIGIDWTTIVFGVVFLLLGFLVKGRSVVALAIAIALFIASGIWSFVVISQTMTRGAPPVGGIVMRILLLIPMIQGFGAISELKASEQNSKTAGSWR